MRNFTDTEEGCRPDLGNTSRPAGDSRKRRGKPFEPGNRQSKGRPPGRRNKLTQLFQETLDEYGPYIMRKAVKMASEGDRTALKLVVDRLIPLTQGSRIALRTTKIRSAADLRKISVSVIEAVLRGDITVEEGRACADMLQAHSRVLEGADLELRVVALEQRGSRSEDAPGLESVAPEGQPSVAPVCAEEELDAR